MVGVQYLEGRALLKGKFPCSCNQETASTTFTKKQNQKTKKGENQTQIAIQASVFPCPFFHVHQSAKPDVQMSCVSKQALV